MLKNLLRSWLKLDQTALEQRVCNLEKLAYLMYEYIDYSIKRIDNNILQLDANMHEVVKAIAATIRPFPGQSNN